MPTIITRGLGYDTPTIIKKIIGDALNGDLIAEDRIRAWLEINEDEIPRATLRSPIPIVGSIYTVDELFGSAKMVDVLIGLLSEEDLPMPSDVRILMYTRDDRTLSLTVNDADDAPINLTGASLWFTVKEKTSDPDASAIFQKKNTAAGGGDTEIKVTDAVNGSAEIYIVPDDTNEVNPGIYVWDVQVKLASGKTYTVLRGRVTFKEDITRAIS